MGKPSLLPFGTSMCCGHPHPQKLNCCKLSLTIGLFSSKLRNVLSNGIVTEDSVDLRSILFCPGRTASRTKIMKIMSAILRSNVESMGVLFETEMYVFYRYRWNDNVRVTVNLSISIIKFFCCLKGNGRPRSSSLGPIKIRTVPLCGVLLRLLTRIVYVKSA